MTLTIDGHVSVIEESRGKTLWVAYVLKDSPWKIILRGDEAEQSLREVMAGNHVVASGSTVKYEDGVFKLFATCCMRFTDTVNS